MSDSILGLDTDKLVDVVTDVLHHSDGGELFLENFQSESLVLENGILRYSESNTYGGFSIRSFTGVGSVFYHSSDISEGSISKAASIVKRNSVTSTSAVLTDEGSVKNSAIIYPGLNPIDEMQFHDKLSFLNNMYSYLEKKTKGELKRSLITLRSKFQVVQVVTKRGEVVNDLRPLVELYVVVILERGGRQEQGQCGLGGRNSYASYFSDWQNVVDKAIKQAEVNLEAVPAPAGEMTVVLSNGWTGILLHEAIGHGLEGDFNRKKTSAFSDLMGKQVAAPEVTVVDDGTVKNARGSINVDDEGTPSQYNVLIEGGNLVSYMHDVMNARLMNTKSTGNGRRESYAHTVLPRMTNTYMLPGDKTPDEIIGSVDSGVYAVNFGGGQVDITSGKFVFLASEAYMIENGKIGTPVKGMTLIGNGPDALTKISMVGNDLQLDSGIGTCSKDGQNLPVGVGQPTVRIDSIVVGGTKVS